MAQQDKTSELVFSADVSQFTRAISQMQSDIKLINSEFDASSSSLDDWSNESEGLEAKLKQLNGTLESQQSILASMKSRQEEYANTLDKNKQSLAKLKQEYDAVIAAEGEKSKNATKLAKDMAKIEVAISKNEKAYKNETISINKQQATINKTSKEINQYQKKLKDLSGDLEDTSKKTKDITSSTLDFKSSMSSIGKGMAGGIAAIGAAAAGAATAFLSLAESTREYRTEMAKLETVSDAANANFDETKKAYQDLVAVTNDEGAATEAINNLLTAGFKGDELEEVNQYIQGAAIQWKDTLKAEGLADSIQEWIGSGGASLTGNIAEMLERLGYNLEEVKDKTAGFSDEQRRAYIMNIMQKEGLGEVSEEYKKQNKDLYDASIAQQNLTDKMADLGAVAEPLTTILKNGFAKVLELIIPYVTRLGEAFEKLLGGNFEEGFEELSSMFFELKDNVQQVFLGLVDGVAEAIPQLLPKIVEFLSQTIQQVVEFAPMLLEAALKLFGALVEALPPTIISLVEQLPQILDNIVAALNEMIPNLLEAAISFLMTIVEALPSVIQSLVQALPKIINTIIEFVMTNLPVVYEAFLKLLMSLIDAIPKVAVEIIKEIPKLIVSIVKTIASNLPKLFTMSVDLWMQLVKAIPKMLPELLGGIGDIVGAILDAFDTDMLVDVGKAIIEGLWDGVKGMKDWLQKKLESAADWLPTWIKKKLGIASPSKVFKEIGKFSADGLGVGFTDEMKKVKKSIVDAVDVDDVSMNTNANLLSTGIGGAGVRGKNVVLNYTVNSPTQLSRREIYLQARKMGTLLGGVS